MPLLTLGHRPIVARICSCWKPSALVIIGTCSACPPSASVVLARNTFHPLPSPRPQTIITYVQPPSALLDPLDAVVGGGRQAPKTLGAHWGAMLWIPRSPTFGNLGFLASLTWVVGCVHSHHLPFLMLLLDWDGTHPSRPGVTYVSCLGQVACTRSAPSPVLYPMVPQDPLDLELCQMFHGNGMSMLSG